MNNPKLIATSRRELEFWITLIPFIIASALLILFEKNSTISRIFLLLLGTIGVIVILRYPTFGFALILISTPLAELMPQISILSSVSPLFGIVTLISFFANEHYRKLIKWNLTNIEILSLVFVFWVILSNPSASILGDTRTWVFTFAQLWIMLWMARQFVRSKSDQQTIMVILAFGIFISALSAIFQIGSLTNLNELNRAAGLSEGSNTAARYFIYGIVLLSYLQSQFTRKPFVRILIFAGIFIFITALFFTGSRTGLILLVFAIILIAQHFLLGRTRSFALIILIGFSIFLFLNQTIGTFLDTKNIIESITSGSDTIGSRYDVWQTGWAMWQDHPIAGVGIGKFRSYVTSYWLSPEHNLVTTPHNTYLQVLSETGFIGFSLFIVLIITVIKNFMANLKNPSRDLSQIQWTWLAILIVLLVGAITKTDLSDKFFWFIIGISANRYHKSTSQIVEIHAIQKYKRDNVKNGTDSGKN